MDFLLTDDEISEYLVNLIEEKGDALSFTEIKKAIAKAQDAKTRNGIFDWLDSRKIGEPCGQIEFIITVEDWQRFRREIKDDKVSNL